MLQQAKRHTLRLYKQKYVVGVQDQGISGLVSGEMPISGHGEHLAMVLTAERQGFHQALATFIPNLSTSESQRPITITLWISHRGFMGHKEDITERLLGVPQNCQGSSE